MEIFHQRLIFGTHNAILVDDVFDAEKEVADKIIIGDAAEHILVSGGFRREIGIIVTGIADGISLVSTGIVRVIIRGNQVKVRGAPFVDIQRFGNRAAGGIGLARERPPWLFHHPDVHEHGQVVNSFSGFGNAIDVTRDAPGTHQFTGFPTEHFRPRSS